MLECILNYSNFLVAVFTAVAAGAAWWAAFQTKKIVKADAILQIRKHLDQLPTIDKNRAPRDFDLEVVSILEDEIYREMVKKYYKAFYIIMCLAITKTINKKTLRKVMTPFELDVFLKIIKPLQEELKVLTDESAFRFFEDF